MATLKARRPEIYEIRTIRTDLESLNPKSKIQNLSVRQGLLKNQIKQNGQNDEEYG